MKLLSLMLICCATISAFADKESHGGSGVVCLDEEQKVISVELTDIYEAREEHGLTVPQSEDTPEKIAEDMGYRLKKADAAFFADYFDVLKAIQEKTEMLEKDGLELVDDVFPTLELRTCQFRQIAVYQKTGQLLIDPVYFNELSNVNKAALYVHEVVYKIIRDKAYSTNSKAARAIVAYLFSDLTDDDFTKIYGDGALRPDEIIYKKKIDVEDSAVGELMEVISPDLIDVAIDSMKPECERITEEFKTAFGAQFLETKCYYSTTNIVDFLPKIMGPKHIGIIPIVRVIATLLVDERMQISYTWGNTQTAETKYKHHDAFRGWSKIVHEIEPSCADFREAEKKRLGKNYFFAACNGHQYTALAKKPQTLCSENPKHDHSASFGMSTQTWIIANPPGGQS